MASSAARGLPLCLRLLSRGTCFTAQRPLLQRIPLKRTFLDARHVRRLSTSRYARAAEYSTPPTPSPSPSSSQSYRSTTISRELGIAVRIVFYTTSSIVLIVAIGFIGIHAYFESVEPTPPAWDIRLRMLYNSGRAAEVMQKDDRAALHSYISVLEALREIDKRKKNNDSMDPFRANVILKIVGIEERLGRWREVVSLLNEAMPLLGESDPRLGACLRRLGEAYLNSGQYMESEKSLQNAISVGLTQGKQDHKEVLAATSSLAGLRTKQGRLKDALNLLLGVFREQQSIPSTATDCSRALVQSQIGEILYGLGDSAEALAWNQKASEAATDMAILFDAKERSRWVGLPRTSPCAECASLASNNVGLLLERAGETEPAAEAYANALRWAQKAEDGLACVDIAENFDRVYRKLHVPI